MKFKGGHFAIGAPLAEFKGGHGAPVPPVPPPMMGEGVSQRYRYLNISFDKARRTVDPSE